eukprot:2856149-Amphidinium_carterae.1
MVLKLVNVSPESLCKRGAKESQQPLSRSVDTCIKRGTIRISQSLVGKKGFVWIRNRGAQQLHFWQALGKQSTSLEDVTAMPASQSTASLRGSGWRCCASFHYDLASLVPSIETPSTLSLVTQAQRDNTEKI